MTLAKAMAKTNETFIVQASPTIIAYDRQNIFLAQATGLIFEGYAGCHVVEWHKSLTNFSKSGKTWAEFSTLEVAVCMSCTRVAIKQNDPT